MNNIGNIIIGIWVIFFIIIIIITTTISQYIKSRDPKTLSVSIQAPTLDAVEANSRSMSLRSSEPKSNLGFRGLGFRDKDKLSRKSL